MQRTANTFHIEAKVDVVGSIPQGVVMPTVSDDDTAEKSARLDNSEGH